MRRLGFSAEAWVGDIPLIVAFVNPGRLHVFDGICGPAALARKEPLIYITPISASIVIPIPISGGFGKIFAAVPAKSWLLPCRRKHHRPIRAVCDPRARSARRSSLYPHSLTAY